MKVSLRDKLALLTVISLDFVGLTALKDREGNPVAILTLAEPIPQVRGSQEVEVNGRRYPLIATDVTEVKVHSEDFNDDFSFDDQTDTGSYKGSELILDVAKSGQVWLRKTSFAQAGSEMRTKFRNERLEKLVTGIEAASSAAKANGKTIVPVDVKDKTVKA